MKIHVLKLVKDLLSFLVVKAISRLFESSILRELADFIRTHASREKHSHCKVCDGIAFRFLRNAEPTHS